MTSGSTQHNMATYDITALDTALEFDTTSNLGCSIQRIPGLDRVILFWDKSSTEILVQCFDVDILTGEITAIGTPLDVEPGTALTSRFLSISIIDASNAIISWAGPSEDGFIQLLSIDGSGNVTTNGSSLEYDIQKGNYPLGIFMDSTHLLRLWASSSNQGLAQIFTIDTGAGTITPEGTPFEFESNEFSRGNVIKLTSTKVVTFYSCPSDLNGKSVVLDINTSTWEVTSAGSVFTFTSSSIMGTSTVLVEDSADFKVVNGIANLTNARSEIASFSINKSTWEITSFGTIYNLSASGLTSAASFTPQVLSVDSNHLVAFYVGASADGYARVVTYDPSDGDISPTANEIEFDTTSFARSASSAFENVPGFYVLAWQGAGSDGFIQAFQVEMPVPTNINPKVKIGGVFTTKPIKVKLSGTFTEKPMKVKVGGIFQ